jgi:hypothetical protein
MIARAALLALALCAGVSAAIASSPNAVEGAWEFKTVPFQGDCVMTGRLIVRPRAGGASHACELVAYQTCTGLKITTKQTCSLSEQNGAVTIKSAIVHSTSAQYAPDDFALKLESPARMTGELRSADIASVVFYRGAEAIS